MKTKIKPTIGWAVVICIATLAGCTEPLTTREKGGLVGAGVGAGTGAIIGSTVGHAAAAPSLADLSDL